MLKFSGQNAYDLNNSKGQKVAQWPKHLAHSWKDGRGRDIRSFDMSKASLLHKDNIMNRAWWSNVIAHSKF